jgi:hypothetical protein
MAKKTDPMKEPVGRPLPALWTLYRVAWTFLTRLCGSVPANPELVQKWLQTRQPTVKPAGALSIEEINEEVLASIERGEGEADQTYSLLVFQRHQGALVQRASTIKAHLKDCGRILSRQYVGKIEGESAFSTRVLNGIYPDERQYWIPIHRPDGSPIPEADDAFDQPVHVYVPGRGQMSALKRIECIEPPCVMTFTLKVLGRSISETDLHHLFSYGGVHGYAGERGNGEGRYSYSFTRQVDPASERAAVAHG